MWPGEEHLSRSMTRAGQVDRIFQRGESGLMNSIACLCVLYEDFRIKGNALTALPGKMEDLETIGAGYRMVYFVRRALATLAEIQRNFLWIQGLPEFKSIEPSLSEQDRRKRLVNRCRGQHWRCAMGGLLKSAQGQSPVANCG
jgi:hypothetical protein